MSQPRMTTTTKLVLAALAAGHTYGRGICKATGLASGTVAPILRRLESYGWLVGEWEQLDAKAAGRPPRRFYRLTAEGHRTPKETR